MDPMFPCLGSVHILRNQVRVGGGQEPHDNIDHTLKGGGG